MLSRRAKRDSAFKQAHAHFAATFAQIHRAALSVFDVALK
jgi:hypothetical protein